MSKPDESRARLIEAVNAGALPRRQPRGARRFDADKQVQINRNWSCNLTLIISSPENDTVVRADKSSFGDTMAEILGAGSSVITLCEVTAKGCRLIAVIRGAPGEFVELHNEV